MSSKKDFIDTINKIAKENGFTALCSNVLGGVIIVDDEFLGTSHYVNFAIVHTGHDYDMEKRTVTMHFAIKAFPSSMGGDPTADDLRRYADALNRAATLINVADAYARLGLLSYTEEF